MTEKTVKLGLPCSLDTMAFSPNKVLFSSGQAQFHPREFMLGLAGKIVGQGGTIIDRAHRRFNSEIVNDTRLEARRDYSLAPEQPGRHGRSG